MLGTVLASGCIDCVGSALFWLVAGLLGGGVAVIGTLFLALHRWGPR